MAELTAQLSTAQSEADTARTNRGRSVPLSVPHIRAIGHLDHYPPAPAPLLAAEIAREGPDHPLLRAGLCDHDPAKMNWAMIAVNDAFAHFANEAAWSTISHTVGVMQSNMFYPDETGKWAQDNR